MHPRTLFTAIFFSAFSLLSGQANLQPGYIIDLNRDTIQGLIDNTGEVKNSMICRYKAGEQSESVDYLPSEILGYNFTDGKYYVSKQVNIEGTEQMVFAECLVKGAASLYYIRNEDTELYFVEKEGTGMVALTNERREEMVYGVMTSYHTYSYIEMLKVTFSDCPEIQPSLENAKLNHRSLVSITCKYNEYEGNGEPCITYEKCSRVRFRIGPFIGFSTNRFKVIGEHPFDAFDFKNSNDPVFGLLLDISSSRLGNHLSFQLGTEWSKSEYEAYYEEQNWLQTATNYYDVYMQGISMKLYGGANYSFTRGRVKPSLGGGLWFHKYIQSDFWYEVERHTGEYVTENEWHPDIASNWLYGVYLQAGVDVDLTKRLILFANVRGGGMALLILKRLQDLTMGWLIRYASDTN